WKGGKFCWDCHDPHGDSNIYMVQKKVATTTEGKFGIPKTRADVTFVDKVSGTSYARKTAPFDGICNVCHSSSSKHYTGSSGDGHNYTRVCTTCHEHRFADSHANRQSCNSCHTSSKPIPKHTAFGLPRDCTKCHAGTIGKRMDVMGQMKANSHHVQGVEVNNRHCYACHWESTEEGLIDIGHHTGYDYKRYTSVKNDYVDLVVWGPGKRPAAYREYSTTDGRATAARFLASSIGTAGERGEVGKVTNHCLACHSDQNNETEPFGDYRKPRQYAWDYQSVGSRYAQTGTAAWGKYNSSTYPNANKKDSLSKAFSAHGNAEQNQGGWSSTTGYDGSITISRGAPGTKNIHCFDCHNSHGSKVVGTTTSYVTFNGSNNGGNLKETKQNMGGYTYDYKASANTSGINPYGAGAGQCFDCHNSASAGTVTSNGKTPWGYGSTFGATAPIMGYKDTERFGQGTKGSTARYSERNAMTAIAGGHLKASEPAGSLPHLAKESGTANGGSTATLTDGTKNWTVNKWKDLYLQIVGGTNAGQLRRISSNTSATITVEAPFTYEVVSGDTYQIVPYTATVNTLCTPCHDPHGISRTLGANQPYALPLLKGTWLTSPYKEDQPPADPTGSSVTNGPDGKPRSWGTYYNPPNPTQPGARYNLDKTTFGTSRISEQDDRFAGLCTNCHQKPALTDGTNKNQNWKTVDRIHESVKGWGANTEHAYSCSKCHQPHNSGLPRLMQTNCLDSKHRGNRVSGGAPWSADSQYGDAHDPGDEHRGFPIANTYGNSPSYEATASCHTNAPLNSGSWPNN
ncbi:MAG TPA: CxxxxCH/CxxCH domain-containing protein, partial [Geobacteraceae bacterium]|nr:CxxxxCH/CxxCH domain-containing protein [Geobacteraceae bacterium]